MFLYIFILLLKIFKYCGILLSILYVMICFLNEKFLKNFLLLKKLKGLIIICVVFFLYRGFLYVSIFFFMKLIEDL